MDETDLSLRKLEELHSEFQDLQRDKSDRLDLLSIVNSLCKVCGIDFKKTVIKIHLSLGNDSKGMKSLANKIIMGLTSTIQNCERLK